MSDRYCCYSCRWYAPWANVCFSTDSVFCGERPEHPERGNCDLWEEKPIVDTEVFRAARQRLFQLLSSQGRRHSDGYCEITYNFPSASTDPDAKSDASNVCIYVVYDDGHNNKHMFVGDSLREATYRFLFAINEWEAHYNES